jgi:hypothetical protein
MRWLVLFMIVGCTVPPEPTRSVCHWIRCGKETQADGRVMVKNCGVVESGTQDGLSTVLGLTTAGAVLSECEEAR